MYGGDAIEDFSSSLTTLFTSETMQPLLNILRRQGVLTESTTTSSIIFYAGGPTTVISKGNYHMRNDLFISLIVISSILGLSSLITLCKIGLCSKDKDLHAQGELKEASTEDTEDSVSPGVLGANDRGDSKDNIAFTPQRGIYNDYNIETPMSERSDATEISSASSPASLNPLGIVSMNKLRKLMYTPEKRQQNTALYDMGTVNEEK